MDQLKNQAGVARTLVINAGENFGPESGATSARSRFILSALAASGVDVIGVGPGDIKSSAAVLQEFREVPVVSANMEGFRPFVRFPAADGGPSVTVTSVVDPELVPSATGQVPRPADPVAALEAVSRRAGDDLLVAILHGDPEFRQTIIDNCPGLDLVVDGLAAEGHPIADMRAKPPVVANNHEGMFVAHLDYAVDGRRFLSSGYKRATVGRVAEDPEVKNLFQQWLRQKQAGFEEKKEKKGRSALLASSGESRFAGSATCQECHHEASRSWSAGKHAKAHETLSRRERGADPDCLACHSTGSHSIHGDSRPPAPGDEWMEGVQCEACHGPAADHVKNPTDTKMPAVTEATCIKCHTSEKDPEFDFTHQIQRICASQ